MKNTILQKERRQANRLYHNQTKKVRLKAKAYAKRQIKKIEGSNFSPTTKTFLIDPLLAYL